MSPTADDPATELEAAAVTRDRVTLEREPELREQGIVLTYRLELSEGDPATVTVVDEIPTELPIEEVGFHDDHAPANWTLEDRTLTVETVVPAEGERVVMFGIPGAGEAAGSASFSSPEISAVEALDPDGIRSGDLDATLPDLEVADRAEAITQVIDDEGSAESVDLSSPQAGDGGDAEGTSEPAASADDIQAAVETVEDDAAEPSRAATSEDADVSADTPPPDELDVEAGLVEALRAELESASEEDREAMVQALGLEPPTSFDARLRHVQTRMDDFVAYADVLEEFLDERGTPEEFIAEINEEIDALEAKLESLGELEDRMIDVESRLEDRVSTVEDRLAEMEDADDERAETVADLEAAVTDLEAAVTDLSEDVDNVAAMRNTLLDALTATEDVGGGTGSSGSTGADDDFEEEVVELKDPDVDDE